MGHDKFKATSDNITSKEILYDLNCSCKNLMLRTNYAYDSIVCKKLVKTVREASDEEINKWFDVNNKSILRKKDRPYLFELLKFSREDLLNMKISNNCINVIDEILSLYGYHLGTNFTEEDLKKIFIVRSHFLDRDFEVKLSLDDREIRDCSKKRMLK